MADIEAKRSEEDRKKVDDKRKKAEETKAREEAALERRRLREAEDQAAQAALKARPVTRVTRDKQEPPQPAPERKAVPSSTPVPTPEIKSRQSAQETKSQASAEADLAYKLYQGGFISRKQLARAVRDRDRAQDEMDKHASGREKLKRELREALTPDTHKPSAKSKETLPPKSKKEREEPER